MRHRVTIAVPVGAEFGEDIVLVEAPEAVIDELSAADCDIGETWEWQCIEVPEPGIYSVEAIVGEGERKELLQADTLAPLVAISEADVAGIRALIIAASVYAEPVIAAIMEGEDNLWLQKLAEKTESAVVGGQPRLLEVAVGLLRVTS